MSAIVALDSYTTFLAGTTRVQTEAISSRVTAQLSKPTQLDDHDTAPIMRYSILMSEFFLCTPPV